MDASVQIDFILYIYPRVTGIHWCQQVANATEIQIGLLIYNRDIDCSSIKGEIEVSIV